MQVSFNNNLNFNGTLKIHYVGTRNKQFSQESIKWLEKIFSYATKDTEGSMDVILYDRYNIQSASADKIIFKSGNYSDYAETYIKTNDSNVLISKLVNIFYGFKNIMKFKDDVFNAFK